MVILVPECVKFFHTNICITKIISVAFFLTLWCYKNWYAERRYQGQILLIKGVWNINFSMGWTSGKHMTQQETYMPIQCKSRANLSEVTRSTTPFWKWHLWWKDMKIPLKTFIWNINSKLVSTFICANVGQKICLLL